MTKEEIQILYKDKILPENKNPYHFEGAEKGNTSIQAYNPMCGDKYQLNLNIVSEKVDAVQFQGFGCAISKASTSILLKKIEGLTKDEVVTFCKEFVQMVTGEKDGSLEDEELQVLIELKNFEGRVDCIKLSWESLVNHLEQIKG